MIRLLIIFLTFHLLSFTCNRIDFVLLGSNTKNVTIKKHEKLEKSEFIFKNSFERDLELVWTLQSNSLLNGWDYSVCAFGQCSIGVPDNGRFKVIKPGESGFFALHLFPKEMLGKGQLVIAVHEKSNPNFKTILTFNVSVIAG